LLFKLLYDLFGLQMEIGKKRNVKTNVWSLVLEAHNIRICK